MGAVRFGRPSAFAADLEASVNGYFRERGIPTTANGEMVARSVVLVAWTVASYAALLAPGLSWGARWAVCVALGVGYAGMGMAIGHDALHGAYSRHPLVNRLLGLTFDVMGASGYIWRFTHNGAHHTYTNVEGLDLDVDYDPVLRMAPGTPRRPFHRWQARYAFLLYPLAGLHWIYVKDFVYFTKRRIPPHRDLRHPWTAWAGLLLGRAFVFTTTIAVPLLVLSPGWARFLTGYLTVTIVAGTTLALVFQLAHAVEGVEMLPAPADGRLESDFPSHQLLTTADFACGNRLLGWYVGGLNFQVEHHLFPHVCSIHYPALRPIVREVAARHGLPHHEFPTFLSALGAHVAHLARLGREDFPSPEMSQGVLPGRTTAASPGPDPGSLAGS